MNKLGAWLVNFMRGRYGFDQLGQALSVGVVVAWIFSVLFGMFARLLGKWAVWASSILNWVGLILLALMIFRMLSRNVEKRRAENEAFLQRRRRRSQRGQSDSNSMPSKESSAQEHRYTYLDCGFCGQKMRVPSGKGKVAVKCPSCGEKTIVES